MATSQQPRQSTLQPQQQFQYQPQYQYQYQYQQPSQQQQQQQQQYQYPAQAQQSSPGAPPYAPASKAAWITKLTFRVLSAIFALVLIGISAHEISFWIGTVILVLPLAIVAFGWDVAEIVCLAARKGHRGIHPGAIVGVDLVLWLSYVSVSVVYGLNTFDGYGYGYYNDFGIIGGGSRAAVLAFAILETLVHFGLFVAGCYETARRNTRPVDPIIYYSSAGAPTQPSVYYQPVVMQSGPYAGATAYQMIQNPQQYPQYQQQQQQQQPLLWTQQMPQQQPEPQSARRTTARQATRQTTTQHHQDTVDTETQDDHIPRPIEEPSAPLRT